MVDASVVILVNGKKGIVGSGGSPRNLSHAVAIQIELDPMDIEDRDTLDGDKRKKGGEPSLAALRPIDYPINYPITKLPD